MQPLESARLLIQVRGLLQELDETKSELLRREQELEGLRAALLRAKETLAAKDARIAELEHRLARGG